MDGKPLIPGSPKQYSCSSAEDTNNTQDSFFVPLELIVSPLVTTKKPRKPTSKRTKFTMLPSMFFLNNQQEPTNLIDVVVQNSEEVPADQKTAQELPVVVIENSDVVLEKSDAVSEKTVSLISKPDNEAVLPKSSEKSTSSAVNVVSEKLPGFLPKCKKPAGMKRLNPVETAAIQMFLNTRMDSTSVWRNGESLCSREQLYPLLFGKMVDDDVIDVFIAIMMEKIKSCPDDYKKVAFVRPLLFSVFQAGVEDAIHEIMKNFVRDFDTADLCLCPIVKSAHWHLLVLDKEKKAYFHYTSLQNTHYDDDAKETRDILDNFIQKNMNFSGTDEYPLIHVTDCPQQKLTSLDCPTFVMRFIDELVKGEPLSLELKDVSLWRLKYAAQIILDGIRLNGDNYSNQQVPVKVVEQGSKVEE
ncbi:hypothetical protein J5N97_027525 [Dioscorea zingiberensis]|uniref:Ubiquitin-like protease family profile domain-containing protein n=1 Tax=Dioscorea zingiberensis TaxID=325984 RepID=A0A9D5C5F3_9LILI|nr:hypothetical protein J5N97_027525 [Dioscorea zingiberensis]